MDKLGSDLVILALVSGIALAAQAASATETASPASVETTRAYAACVVTDEAKQTLYATSPGRVDSLTRPVTLDAKGYAAWVARVYHVQEDRLSAADCVVDERSKGMAEMRLQPLLEAGRRQGLQVERTRWWLSQ